jgi:WXG100 family type VII secretion target
MEQKVSVDAAQIRATANAVDEHHQQLIAHQQTLYGHSETLRAQYMRSAAAGKAYDGVMADWQTNADKINQKMGQIKDLLHQAADKFVGLGDDSGHTIRQAANLGSGSTYDISGAAGTGPITATLA